MRKKETLAREDRRIPIIGCVPGTGKTMACCRVFDEVLKGLELNGVEVVQLFCCFGNDFARTERELEFSLENLAVIRFLYSFFCNLPKKDDLSVFVEGILKEVHQNDYSRVFRMESLIKELKTKGIDPKNKLVLYLGIDEYQEEKDSLGSFMRMLVREMQSTRQIVFP